MLIYVYEFPDGFDDQQTVRDAIQILALIGNKLFTVGQLREKCYVGQQVHDEKCQQQYQDSCQSTIS